MPVVMDSDSEDRVDDGLDDDSRDEDFAPSVKSDRSRSWSVESRPKQPYGPRRSPLQRQYSYNHVVVDESVLTYCCCYCREVFTTEYALSVHMYRHLKMYEILPTKNNFDEERGLLTAKQLYLKFGHPYFCGKCGKSFYNLVTAKHHCVSSHRGPSKIICLLLKDGIPSGERRMITFEEFVAEEAYIEYDLEPLRETECEYRPNESFPELSNLQPTLRLDNLSALKKRSLQNLMAASGVKKWKL